MFCCIQFPEWIVGEVDIPRCPYSALRILIKPIHKYISLHDDLKIRLKSDLLFEVSNRVLIILSRDQLSLKQIRIWIRFHCFLPLKEFFFNIPPFLLEILEDLRASQYKIIERKLIRLNPDRIWSCSASAVFSATVLFQDKHFSAYDTVNDSNMAVLSLSFDYDISLHEIICPNNLLSASIEEIGLRHLLCVPELSYLTKS